MDNPIAWIGALIIVLSLLGILTGFSMVFHKDTKKQGITFLIYSLIGIIIGFGTCGFLFNM